MGNYNQPEKNQIRKYGGFSKGELQNIQNIFDSLSDQEGLLVKDRIKSVYVCTA